MLPSTIKYCHHLLPPVTHSRPSTSCIRIFQLTSLAMITPGTAKNLCKKLILFSPILTGIFVPQSHQSTGMNLRSNKSLGLDIGCFLVDPQYYCFLESNDFSFYQMLHQPNEYNEDVPRQWNFFLENLSLLSMILEGFAVRNDFQETFCWINHSFSLVILRTSQKFDFGSCKCRLVFMGLEDIRKKLIPMLCKNKKIKW